MYKLKQFLEENQDFKNYINTRINDNVDIDIIYDELDILHKDFKIDDLIEYKNSDDFKNEFQFNKASNKKSCPVCIFLTIYPKEFVLEVDSLIFSNGKYQDFLSMIENSSILNNKQKPSKHYIEKHRIDCLSDFILKVDNTKNISVKNNYPTSIDLQSSLDEYEKMSVQERDNSHIERLRKIKYLSGVVILQELLSGKHSKSIPKEDISALKQIEDIVAGIGEANAGLSSIEITHSIKRNENDI